MNKMKYTLIIFLIAFLGIKNVMNAQEDDLKSPKYILVNLSFSFQTPMGDNADRYGWNNSAGVGLDYLSSKNFIIGANTDYLFGTRVKEDVLANIRNSDGQIIGNNRAISNIKLTQRGWNSNIYFGKLFPVSKKDYRSGIRVTLGGGFLQHKIRIQQDPQSLVPQTTGEYRKGYDRLSNGFSLRQFIGYQKVSVDKRINFIFGAELIQGFTQNQRAWDFDLQAKDEGKYFDFLLGGKFSWTIPFEIGKDPEEIFY